MFFSGKGLRPTESNPRFRHRRVRPKRILHGFLYILLCYPSAPARHIRLIIIIAAADRNHCAAAMVFVTKPTDRDV